MLEHLHMDINGDEYIGTNGVETDPHYFEVWSDSDGDVVELELNFSVFIQDNEQYWRVTLKDPSDIPLLKRLLVDRQSPIEIRQDQTVLERCVLQLNQENQALQAKLNSVWNILTGFDDELVLDDWRNLPPIPTGWGLLRILRGWLKADQFDYTQIEFVLWMLSGRSQEIWQYLYIQDQELAETMSAGLLSVLNSKFSGFQGSAAHGRGSPKYLKWQAEHRRLEIELSWLFNSS